MRRRRPSMRRRGSRRRLSTTFKRYRRGRGRYVDKKTFKRNVRAICVGSAGAITGGIFTVNAETGVTGNNVPATWTIGGVNPGSSFAASVNATLRAGTTAVYDLPFAMSFRFADILNAQEFASLFDQYKLNYVVVKFTPTWTVNTSVPAAATMPSIEYKIDHDDIQEPTPLIWAETAAVRGPVTFNKPISIKIRPTMLTPAIRSTTTSTTYTVVSGARTNDMAFTDVEHFGLKGWIKNLYSPAGASGVQNQLFQIDATYYFSCKGLQ